MIKNTYRSHTSVILLLISKTEMTIKLNKVKYLKIDTEIIKISQYVLENNCVHTFGRVHICLENEMAFCMSSISFS